jgi:hypothetical protein
MNRRQKLPMESRNTYQAPKHIIVEKCSKLMNKFCEHGHVISMLLVQMPEEFDMKIQNSFSYMKRKQLACSDASFCTNTS